MLVARRKVNGMRVVASTEGRGDGPWVCPSCKADVTIKKGSIKIHHFAHYPPITCAYGAGESDLHRQCKFAIWEAMSRETRCTRWELERNLGTVRPDVSGYIDDLHVAIEVQASALPLDTIAHRTREYATKKIAVLWVVPGLEPSAGEAYSPRVYEKWLHTLYFGRVYWWYKGATVHPIHFGEYRIWFDDRSWFDSDGDEHTAGDYERISKRWRTPEPGPLVDVLSMRHAERPAWTGGAFSVPASRILLDSLPRWWKQ